MGPALSVVIPTYNEAANIGPLLVALDKVFADLDVEYVVVDDNSKDATAANGRAGSPRARVIVRTTERGLATAVVRGIQEATGTYVAVMDADFQHPPQAVRALYDKALSAQAELVVGSRYADGGTEGKFGFVRRNISRGAAWLAKAALPPVRQHGITDPMSGLFLLRRDAVDTTKLHPQGYKVLLEIMARTDFQRVAEVGYKFDTRREGDSKLGATVLWQYIVHLAALGATHPENHRIGRFIAVGASGVVVNAIAFLILEALGLEYHVALLLAIEASILSNFALNDRYTFNDRRQGAYVTRMGLFNLVSLTSAAIQFLTVALLVDFMGMPHFAAIGVGILAGLIPNYIGNSRLTYTKQRPKASTWAPILLLVLASSAIYLGGLAPAPALEWPALDGVGLNPHGNDWGIRDIYFDEHYYVSVAHQMDNGIWEDPCWINDGKLDHRPLNYEHPPLAKLILYASVHAYDSTHSVFLGCREPDKNDVRDTACFTLANGTNLYTGKSCYDAFTADLRTNGNAWSWRAPSAVMGIITVTFAALASRRLFRSDLAGALAGGFVLMDNLILSSSRIALLDIYATGFAVLAVYCATFANRRGLLLSALFLGLGFSCKYYVLFVGPPVLLLSLWTHLRAGKLRKRRFDLHLVAYPFIALTVWMATYTPWWVIWYRTYSQGTGWHAFSSGVTGALSHWSKVQKESIGWLTVGVQEHQYASPPVEWLPMVTPMSYIGPGTPFPSGDFISRYIYAIGNPILWWGACIAVFYIFVDLIFDWVGSLFARPADPLVPFRRMGLWKFFSSRPIESQALFIAALFPLFVYGGFLFLNPPWNYAGPGTPHRTTFIFYMTVVVPFFGIVLAGLLAHAWSSGSALARTTVLVVSLLVLAGFLYFFKISVYLEMPRTEFHRVLDAVPWMHECGNQHQDIGSSIVYRCLDN